MRALRFILPAAIPLSCFIACDGGDFVGSDVPMPGSGGVANPGSGGVVTGAGGEIVAAGGSLGSGGAGAPGGEGGDAHGAGGASDGDGCHPRVHLLIQRSGAMFETPSTEDNWWDAVADALDGDDGLLAEFAPELDLSVSTYTKHEEADSCPAGASLSAPVSAGELADFLESEAAEHHDLADDDINEDAPIVDAIEATASLLGSSGDRYILLIASGIPDSCELNNNPCTAEDAILAVQAAHTAGISTRVAYLSSTNVDRYPEGLANAGVGEGVEDLELGGCGAGESPEFSDEPGDAPFADLDATADVRQALAELLADIAACE